LKKLFTLGIALFLALILCLAIGIPALAWDVEDQQINANAQMDETRGYSLEDMLDNGQGNSPIYPGEGDYIYVDTYSHSGNLAHLSILRTDDKRVRKYSTEEMALADPGNTGKWKAYDGDMFYFAPEPRGYNIILPEFDNEDCSPYEGVGGFLIILFNEKHYQGVTVVDWKAKPQVLAEPASVEGKGYRIDIPEGTGISLPNGFKASFLKLESISSNTAKFSPSQIDFTQPVILSELVDGEWIEVISFISIRGGTAQ